MHSGGKKKELAAAKSKSKLSLKEVPVIEVDKASETEQAASAENETKGTVSLYAGTSWSSLRG